MATNRVQPDYGTYLQGDLSVMPFDVTLINPSNVLDTASINAVDHTLTLSGVFASSYGSNTDHYCITVYLQEAGTGTNQTLGPVNFTGDQGTLSGGTLTFPPDPTSTLLRISIPANSVPAGVYRMTAVLTHSGRSPQILGFVDYGMVEFV